MKFTRIIRRLNSLSAVKLFLIYPLIFHANAVAGAEDLSEIRAEMESLRRQQAELESRLLRLQNLMVEVSSKEREPDEKPSRSLADALDQALAAADAVPAPSGREGAGRELASARAGSAQLRLFDLSVAVVGAAGGATVNDDALQNLQAGEHDPARRGVTLQQAEISIGGAVDPYFSAAAHLNFSEDEGAELEEAYISSRALPWNLEGKAGYYLTEFGRMNSTHAHDWDWMDQPVINTRLLGPDGQRGVGARVAALLPLPWFSEIQVGLQNPDDESMQSFGGGSVGGRPMEEMEVSNLGDFVYLSRFDNFFEISETLSTKIGLSALYGPNSSGDDGYTVVYGADMVAKWLPPWGFRGYPYLTFQSEVMARHYSAAESILEEEIWAAESFDDWGFYAQLLYGFKYGWAGGFRTEYASGSGGSSGHRQDDPWRDDRLRLSPLVSWRLTEFSRLRLQYNHDRAKHLDSRESHGFWVGWDIILGTHPAHKY